MTGVIDYRMGWREEGLTFFSNFFSIVHVLLVSSLTVNISNVVEGVYTVEGVLEITATLPSS